LPQREVSHGDQQSAISASVSDARLAVTPGIRRRSQNNVSFTAAAQTTEGGQAVLACFAQLPFSEIVATIRQVWRTLHFYPQRLRKPVLLPRFFRRI